MCTRIITILIKIVKITLLLFAINYMSNILVSTTLISETIYSLFCIIIGILTTIKILIGE